MLKNLLGTSVVLFFIASAFLSSCTFNPNVQGRGADVLQGVWDEQPYVFRDSLIQYTSHHFKFTCDSFYVVLSTRAKHNYYEDSCFNGGSWKEYAKGTYVVSRDTLYLLGTFTKSNYKQKLHDCYRIGQYIPVFLIKNTSSDKIELQSLQQHIPVTLKLKEKIICNPQPL
ncbi:fumarate hydratase [Desertivirga arenae]|uniref:fumarate hydratase n=1 Tax=Desertivirga arenae TaxID=2810309 RepID=UPI001A97B320|nr:fumarate hydratase [Pedobacter sp. SYSU D00823]